MKHFCLRAAIIACGIFAAASPALTEEAYWLTHGSDVPVTCEGASEPQPVKLSGAASDEFLVTALAKCTDLGDTYRISLDFLRIDKQSWPGILRRDAVTFNWVGLAIYKPASPTRDRIEWLYDEAVPIRGTLSKTSRDPLYFSAIAFDVPKASADAATYFTFYLTWDAWMTPFGAL